MSQAREEQMNERMDEPAEQPVENDQVVELHQQEGAEERLEYEPLLGMESDGLHTRWEEIQAGFVDDPRGSLQRADGLVQEAMELLTKSFAGERAMLEEQWDRGDEVSTEDLRMALRHYRSFFNRLLAA